MIELLVAGTSLAPEPHRDPVPLMTRAQLGEQTELPLSAAFSHPVFVSGPPPVRTEPVRMNLPARTTALRPLTNAASGASAGAWKGAPPIKPTPNWMQAARQLLGVRYRLGGTSARGIDCSGFTQRVLASVGIRLPRTSREQARRGTPVPLSSLQAGDLVFFDTAGRGNVTHVGLYIGSDQFMNANSYAGRVKVDRLVRDPYWKRRYLGGRRVMTQVQASLSGPQVLSASLR